MHDISTPFGPPGFLTLTGSRLYGIDTPTSDWDYAGAVIESSDYVLGLENYGQQNGFEQYEFKNPDENYEGSVYGLRKFVRMLADGNPTILCLMFAPNAHDEYGITTEKFRSMILSKQSGIRFLKYMAAQRRSMLGQRSKHVQRLDLVERHGYDTKFAGHVLRLGYQGVEFLRTKHITLPMEPSQALDVLAIRAGEWSMDSVLEASVELECEIESLLAVSDLPETADYNAIHKWLVRTYRYNWLM